jgi:hypothetical protein
MPFRRCPLVGPLLCLNRVDVEPFRRCGCNDEDVDQQSPFRKVRVTVRRTTDRLRISYFSPYRTVITVQSGMFCESHSQLASPYHTPPGLFPTNPEFRKCQYIFGNLFFRSIHWHKEHREHSSLSNNECKLKSTGPSFWPSNGQSCQQTHTQARETVYCTCIAVLSHSTSTYCSTMAAYQYVLQYRIHLAVLTAVQPTFDSLNCSTTKISRYGHKYGIYLLKSLKTVLYPHFSHCSTSITIQ